MYLFSISPLLWLSVTYNITIKLNSVNYLLWTKSSHYVIDFHGKEQHLNYLPLVTKVALYNSL